MSINIWDDIKLICNAYDQPGMRVSCDVSRNCDNILAAAPSCSDFEDFSDDGELTEREEAEDSMFARGE